MVGLGYAFEDFQMDGV